MSGGLLRDHGSFPSRGSGIRYCPPNICSKGTPKNFGPPEITATKNYML